MEEDKFKFTRDQKRVALRNLLTATIGKLPYIILGYIIYPFINRSKVRKKYYSGKYSWYTKQLWYMINDDEWHRYGDVDNIDYDIEKVKEKGIKTDTKWGRFKASYWFNAMRNPAYNKGRELKNYVTKKYSNQEVEIDNIYKNRGETKVNPLLRAEWRWVTKEGLIDNMGERISWKYSRIGEGLVWFNPNNNLDIVDFRYSKAFEKKVFGKSFYITFQCGDWGDKLDIIFKIQKEKD